MPYTPANYEVIVRLRVRAPDERTALARAGHAVGNGADDDEHIDSYEVDGAVWSDGGDVTSDETAWGEHKRFTRSDWTYEVQNGYTSLGYWEWVQAQHEPGPTDEERG